MNIIDSSVSFTNSEFIGGCWMVWALIILSVIIAWAILVISCILKKGVNTLKEYWEIIAENEGKLIELGTSEEDKKKREQIEKSINRIVESENLFILGRYLTIIVAGFLFVIVVVIIGLVLLLKI